MSVDRPTSADGSRLIHGFVHGEEPNVLESMYLAIILSRGYRHVRADNWSVAVDSSLPVVESSPLASLEQLGWSQQLLDGAETLTQLRLVGSRFWVSVAGATAAAAEDVLSTWRERLPELRTDDTLVRLQFWTHGRNAPEVHMRRLHAPAWPEIAANYPEPAREQLARLMDPDWRPGDGGQLILWQGLPGSGKTHALRSLLHAWRGWCDGFYVADPERFFGEGSYLMHVLLTAAREDTWHLLILEDAGELLAADAKLRTGQGLSRLLNSADGLIGQGLRVLILLTTNEQLGQLHPAVSRPGRTAAIVRFDAFSSKEANAWLAARGSEETITSSATLAELYALLRGDPMAAASRRDGSRVGFAVRGGDHR
jgi:hypothetical protein